MHGKVSTSTPHMVFANRTKPLAVVKGDLSRNVKNPVCMIFNPQNPIVFQKSSIFTKSFLGNSSPFTPRGLSPECASHRAVEHQTSTLHELAQGALHQGSIRFERLNSCQDPHLSVTSMSIERELSVFTI